MHEPIELKITFPGNKRVDTELGGHLIRTDQPVAKGGEDSAPAPFDLFLAAIGTCAGIYVASFCQKREIPLEGVAVRQRVNKDPETGAITEVSLDIEVPKDFPEKYHQALVRAVDGCAVKKTIQAQPRFEVKTVVTG
jgi:putative redox protein